MEKPDMEYARKQVARLDEWAKGFLVGCAFGIVTAIGVAASILEPLK